MKKINLSHLSYGQSILLSKSSLSRLNGLKISTGQQAPFPSLPSNVTSSINIWKVSSQSAIQHHQHHHVLLLLLLLSSGICNVNIRYYGKWHHKRYWLDNFQNIDRIYPWMWSHLSYYQSSIILHKMFCSPIPTVLCLYSAYRILWLSLCDKIAQNRILWLFPNVVLVI